MDLVNTKGIFSTTSLPCITISLNIYVEKVLCSNCPCLWRKNASCIRTRSSVSRAERLRPRTSRSRRIYRVAERATDKRYACLFNEPVLAWRNFTKFIGYLAHARALYVIIMRRTSFYPRSRSRRAVTFYASCPSSEALLIKSFCGKCRNADFPYKMPTCTESHRCVTRRFFMLSV